jgi:5'-3' exonuclease
MGIRNLNRFIQTKCPNASIRISLEELRGKKIAVDTSIYMYRYAGENALLENMYLMASIFRHYDIHAVFVFDGIPPPQKTELIESRRRKKDHAKQQYDIVAHQLKERKLTEYYNPEIAELEETMTQLRKRFARLRDCDIQHVKELLVGFGFAIIDAEGEADVLCAKLAIKKRVHACLSDDTDMFVYGCPVVLRHISLLNHSVVSYTMSEVLSELGISQHEFKMICVVNGTDYDTTAATLASGDDRIFKIYDLLMEFRRLSPKEEKKYHDGGGFYDWLDECKKDIVANTSVISLMSNEALFDTSTSDKYKQVVILNRDDIHKRRIVEIMMKEDFIFVEPDIDDNDIQDTISSGNGNSI